MDVEEEKRQDTPAAAVAAPSAAAADDNVPPMIDEYDAMANCPVCTYLNPANS
jgi:hypothetical protein